MRAGTVVGDGTGRAVSSTVLSLMTGFRRDAMDFRIEILNLPMPQTSILLTPIRPDSPGNRQVASTTHTCIRSAPRSQGFNHIKPRIQDWPGSTERPSGKPLYERPYRCELSQKIARSGVAAVVHETPRTMGSSAFCKMRWWR